MPPLDADHDPSVATPLVPVYRICTRSEDQRGRTFTGKLGSMRSTGWMFYDGEPVEVRYNQMIRSKTPWHQSDPRLAFSCFADQDAKMHHMKKASVLDLRYRSSEVERLLERGEKIEITKRKEVIGHLLP